MTREYHFYVYMLQSASRRAIYVGVTNNLRHRVFQHKTHQYEGFTDDYNAIRLVYFEKFDSVGKAIAREAVSIGRAAGDIGVCRSRIEARISTASLMAA